MHLPAPPLLLATAACLAQRLVGQSVQETLSLRRLAQTEARAQRVLADSPYCFTAHGALPGPGRWVGR